MLLLQDLQSETANALLRKVQRLEPLLSRFPSWKDVIALMQNTGAKASEKDSILRTIFLARQEDDHPTWGSVLLLFFWPGLLNLYRKTFNYDQDLDELWRTITATFLEAVNRLDVNRRPDRIAMKLMNDTRSYLYEKYTRIWNHLKRYGQQEPEFWKKHEEVPATDHGQGKIEYRGSVDEVMRILKNARASGVIDEHDLSLLIGTIVYGKALADCAREAGLSYEAAKKRRQRACSSLKTWCTRKEIF